MLVDAKTFLETLFGIRGRGLRQPEYSGSDFFNVLTYSTEEYILYNSIDDKLIFGLKDPILNYVRDMEDSYVFDKGDIVYVKRTTITKLLFH